MAISVQIIREGRDYWATADGGPRFFVGRQVTYQGRVGLTNIFPGTPLPRLDYDPQNYAERFGFWAALINPTAGCEGRNFLTLNSYDRAGFSFGFGQFAAHVPNGDFVRWLHAMLALPEAQAYFPDLSIIGGRVHAAGVGPLEWAGSTSALMAWLNPMPSAVDTAEVLTAARLIHWTATHRPARLAQIAQMIASFRGSIAKADRRGLIEGRTAAQCCVIADLLHHGRGGRTVWASVAKALAAADPLDALIAIGAAQWAERTATLSREILAMPDLHKRRWSRAAGDFV
ncbi:MAG: hypothetical protein ACKOPR_05875 [Chakrabartia godavariana]